MWSIGNGAGGWVSTFRSDVVLDRSQALNPFLNILRRVFRPLGSRKVRVALATVIAAYLTEAGMEASQEVLLTILGTGVALILGIAHEDAGRSRELRD